KVFWYDGKKRVNGQEAQNLPPRDLLDNLGGAETKSKKRAFASGILLIGAKGKLYSTDDYGNKWTLLPEKDFENFEGPPETIPRSPGHFKEWVDACKGGPKTMSDFAGRGGLLAEVVALGCVAERLPGKKIEWDGKRMVTKNCPEAQPLIRPEFPKGWILDGVKI
ncbi:hypothetical protein FJY63_12110, partial [Candidatus Sumerlaeota bacterium]|nr:hypothetical protein [Candidatus Sumerlaeota bacterium]